MKHHSPLVLFMIQEYDWVPALIGLLSDLGIRVERVDSIRELQERWTEETPAWIVVDGALSRVLAAHLSMPAPDGRESPGMLIVSDGLREGPADVERRLARYASPVKT